MCTCAPARLYKGFYALTRSQTVACLRSTGVLPVRDLKHTDKLVQESVASISRSVCASIARLHSAGFAALLVLDPLVTHDVKTVNKTRIERREECILEVKRAEELGQLHLVPLATLQAATGARTLLQPRILSSVSAAMDVGVCHSKDEADLAINALVRAGNVHAVLSNDSGSCMALPRTFCSLTSLIYIFSVAQTCSRTSASLRIRQ